MERDKCFSSLLYSICKGLNSFFSSETRRKYVLWLESNCITTLKNWPFVMNDDFIIKTEDGKVFSALCSVALKRNVMISCEERQVLEALKALS